MGIILLLLEAFNRYQGLEFSNLLRRSLTTFEKYGLSRLSRPARIRSIVPQTVSSQKGRSPESIRYRVTPTDQMSTFSLYPPPQQISGAVQNSVPVLVHMSVSLNSLKMYFLNFLLTPRSMILIGQNYSFDSDFFIYQSRILSGFRSL